MRRAWLSVSSLVALALVASQLAVADDVHDALALDLIAAMKLEDQANVRAERLIIAQCRVRKCDADMRKCMLRVKPELIDSLPQRLKSAVTRELTPDEIRSAIAYFRIEAGLRHLDVLRTEQGLGGSETFFTQPRAIQDQMLAFLGTRAGYLLITRAILREGVNSWVQRRDLYASWDCVPKQ